MTLNIFDPKKYLAPGKYNAWHIDCGEWKILLDNNGIPLEFDTKEDAVSFIHASDVLIPANHCLIKEGSINSNGHASSRPAPCVLHDFSYMRRERDEAISLAKTLTDDEGELFEFLINFFMSKNGAEQGRLWVDFLYKNKRINKEQIKQLESSRGKWFVKVLKELYSCRSYHSALACLETFAPAKREL